MLHEFRYIVFDNKTNMCMSVLTNIFIQLIYKLLVILLSIVLKTQEREAREEMKRKAKELQAARLAAAKGKPSARPSMMGFGGSGKNDANTSVEITPAEPVAPKPSRPVRFVFGIFARACTSFRSLIGPAAGIEPITPSPMAEFFFWDHFPWELLN